MTEINHPRGSYFEEFVLGATHSSTERAITEADISASPRGCWGFR
jgi:hypothetical protein